MASDSTAFRVLDKIATTPGMLEALERAHATAREHVWKRVGAPPQVTIDADATLLNSHSEKEGAAGNLKGGFGFHPILAYSDETRESLASMLRPGNAGANSAADQIAVAEAALQQIPREHIETIRVLLRVDSAGACHELLDWAHDANIRFSVGAGSARERARASCRSPTQTGSQRSTRTAPSAPTARSSSSPTSTSPTGRRGRASSFAASARTPARN
jgi:hypothetical protein